ncbi:MAG: ferredoxin--NADP reductase [Hyphomicrobium sp.]
MLDNPPKRSEHAQKTAARPSPSGFYRERVLDIQHYTDKLFSFRTTRTQSFRFQSGQFTMIGLETEPRPILRAYSMASAVYDDWLEFFSIKVPDGPLTSKLQHIVVGDEILVGAKPTGTLLASNLQPGSRLFLLATGTGFAPFASILRDPEIYERFDTVVAVEGCRQAAELAYATSVIEDVRSHEFLGELAAGKLLYYATVTREPYYHQGRIPDLIDSGKLCDDLAIAPFNLATDRVMLCGNPQMLADLRKLFAGRGYAEGSSGKPGDFVIEKAFAER